MATNKEKLIGSRLGNLIRTGVSNIPDNKATRSVGFLANLINANVHRNPLTRLYTNAENFVVDKGASLAEKHLKIDPLIAQMGIGFAIPGPAGEVKTAKKILKPTKRLKINGGNGTAKRLLEIENANAEKALLQKNRVLPSDSTISSVTSDVADELVYGKGTKKIKATIPKELGGKLDTLTQIKGVPNKEFHHVFMKDLSAEYVAKARELVTQGKATPEDVIMLDRIAKKYGFGLGDYKTAGIYADRIPHSSGHKKAIELGIQPSPAGPGPDLDTTKLKIKQTSDIKELFKSFEDSIKEIAIPMKDEIEGFQEAWDRIDVSDRFKLIELRLERKALRKSSKTAVKVRNKELVKVETQYAALKKKLQTEMGVIRDRLDEVKIQKKDIEIDNLHSAFAG